MNLPPNAIKDHNFFHLKNNVNTVVFKCSKCNVLCAVPYDNGYYPPLGIDDFLAKQGFYYYYLDYTWKDVRAINNLSCAELIIKDIIE